MLAGRVKLPRPRLLASTPAIRALSPNGCPPPPSEADPPPNRTLSRELDKEDFSHAGEAFGRRFSLGPRADLVSRYALSYLDIYTSYRLHFLPYELTRCEQLRDSRVSTRALFGNFKHRPPFPDLTRADNTGALSLLRPSVRSVCSSPLTGPVVLRWITLSLGTDWFPLLVNACSAACIDALPNRPKGMSRTHTPAEAESNNRLLESSCEGCGWWTCAT